MKEVSESDLIQFQIDLRKGDVTDKGIIEDIFFLTFANNGQPVGFKTYEPSLGRKGLIMVKVDGKDYPIGDVLYLH